MGRLPSEDDDALMLFLYEGSRSSEVHTLMDFLSEISPELRREDDGVSQQGLEEEESAGGVTMTAMNVCELLALHSHSLLRRVDMKASAI